MSRSPTKASNQEHSIPRDILDDLSSRFIINVPDEERLNPIRVCFQLELAHWFYLDFYCEEDATLEPCSMRDFATHMFQHISFLRPHLSETDSVLEKWREYKQMVPTYGAIMVDPSFSNVLLAQGYWAKSSWGFPKGKINAGESPVRCAIREVLEETGFDISKLIDENLYLETNLHDQVIRLYVVKGVPMTTNFEPQTRREIRSLRWFPISDLPVSRKDLSGPKKNGLFMVMPFVKDLKRLITREIGNGAEKRQQQQQQQFKQFVNTAFTESFGSANRAVQGRIGPGSASPIQPNSRKNEGNLGRGRLRRNLSGDFAAGELQQLHASENNMGTEKSAFFKPVIPSKPTKDASKEFQSLSWSSFSLQPVKECLLSIDEEKLQQEIEANMKIVVMHLLEEVALTVERAFDEATCDLRQ